MRSKRIIGGIGIFIVVIMFFVAIMTWFYPFSPFSVHQSYTYKPGKVLYDNDKTYKDILNEFKRSYKKDLNESLKSNHTDFTVDRTQYILPIYEQEWLIGTDSKSMDKNKLNEMLFDVKGARDTLLGLVTEGDYTAEEKGYLVGSITNLLHLEESIRQLRDGKYFTRSDLNTLFGNLRNEFRSDFEIYTTTFYNRSHE